ncbi:hypothetical protein [Marinitoga lauensis]
MSDDEKVIKVYLGEKENA